MHDTIIQSVFHMQSQCTVLRSLLHQLPVRHPIYSSWVLFLLGKCVAGLSYSPFARNLVNDKTKMVNLFSMLPCVEEFCHLYIFLFNL